MKIKKSLLTLIAVPACWFYAAHTSAGTLAVFDVVGVEVQNQAVSQVQIAIQDHLMRIEHSGKVSADQPQVIFNSQTGELIIIDDAERSFTRIDKATREAMAQKLASVKVQMEAQFAAMPPEQRQMMESMMKDSPLSAMFGKQVKKDIQYKKTAQSETAAGYACAVHEKYVDGKKQSDFCIAAADKIQGGTEVFAMMQSLMAVFNEAASLLPMQDDDNPWLDMQSLKGIPLKVTSYDQGAVKEKMSLKGITSTKHDAKLFSVPAGYRENKIDAQGFL